MHWSSGRASNQASAIMPRHRVLTVHCTLHTVQCALCTLHTDQMQFSALQCSVATPISLNHRVSTRLNYLRWHSINKGFPSPPVIYLYRYSIKHSIQSAPAAFLKLSSGEGCNLQGPESFRDKTILIARRHSKFAPQGIGSNEYWIDCLCNWPHAQFCTIPPLYFCPVKRFNSSHLQGAFFTGPPPKKLEYIKPRLG